MLSALRGRIGTVRIATRVWERQFTDADRDRLGGDLDKCLRRYGTAGMWVQAKGVPVERAIVRVALATDLITGSTADWLLKELGEEEGQPAEAERPVWDVDRGELRWGQELIRNVRIMKRPSKTQQILDAFQNANWTATIQTPFDAAASDVDDVITNLNKNLRIVTFHSRNRGKEIYWTVQDGQSEDVS